MSKGTLFSELAGPRSGAVFPLPMEREAAEAWRPVWRRRRGAQSLEGNLNSREGEGPAHRSRADLLPSQLLDAPGRSQENCLGSSTVRLAALATLQAVPGTGHGPVRLSAA